MQVLGIKFKQTPIMAISVVMVVVAVQLLNKFLYLDNGKDMATEAHNAGAGFASPFLQAGAVGMYDKDINMNARKIVTYVFYYLFLLLGLMVSESVLGHYTMLVTLLMAVVVNTFIPIFSLVSCNSLKFSQPDFCCGENISWFYLGVLCAILFNYHYLSNKKITHMLYMFLFLAVGVGIYFFNALFYNKNRVFEVKGDKVEGDVCYNLVNDVVPYLLGGLLTMSQLGLLLK
jgi:hypothetical protein